MNYKILHDVLTNKFGYYDKDANKQIPFKFDGACDFNLGIASVCVNGKWGCINEDGKSVIENKYKKPVIFNEKGLAPVVEEITVMKDDKYIIDLNGERCSDNAKSMDLTKIKDKSICKQFCVNAYLNGEMPTAELPDVVFEDDKTFEVIRSYFLEVSKMFITGRCNADDIFALVINPELDYINERRLQVKPTEQEKQSEQEKQ